MAAYSILDWSVVLAEKRDEELVQCCFLCDDEGLLLSSEFELDVSGVEVDVNELLERTV
jgi:hypothetical protein